MVRVRVRVRLRVRLRVRVRSIYLILYSFRLSDCTRADKASKINNQQSKF